MKHIYINNLINQYKTSKKKFNYELYDHINNIKYIYFLNFYAE